MFIDASALTAILVEEPDRKEILERMLQRSIRITSPLVVWETATAVACALRLPPQRATQRVMEYLELVEIDLVEVPPETAILALSAFERFGKGRHKAALNFGDCFAYACARHFRQPLLYKGTDFSQTDIETA